jgi:phosphoserine / homoserine phosphotransferase
MICCLDLEGVLTPEIWIEVAKQTKVKELCLTTRDEPDYDILMQKRLEVLKKNRIRLIDIQKVISGMSPLPGAKTFLNKLRTVTQVICVSDTYYEFAGPLIKKLGAPTLFCNWLTVDHEGYIGDYHLRQANGKQHVVEGLKGMGFSVKAAGDSYNDITMLKAADLGVLFRPPDQIVQEFPQFPVTQTHAELLKALTS